MCTSIIASTHSPRQAALTFEQVRQSCKAAGVMIARCIGPNLYEVPSATERGTVYTVTLAGPRALCSCPDGGARCWHGKRAHELAAAAAPAAAPALSPKQAAYRAAYADVFGAAA